MNTDLILRLFIKVGRPATQNPGTSFNTNFPANQANSDYVVIPGGSDGGANTCIAPSTAAGGGAAPVPTVD